VTPCSRDRPARPSAAAARCCVEGCPRWDGILVGAIACDIGETWRTSVVTPCSRDRPARATAGVRALQERSAAGVPYRYGLHVDDIELGSAWCSRARSDGFKVGSRTRAAVRSSKFLSFDLSAAPPTSAQGWRIKVSSGVTCSSTTTLAVFRFRLSPYSTRPQHRSQAPIGLDRGPAPGRWMLEAKHRGGQLVSAARSNTNAARGLG
jgi:hypothetical protein